MSARLRQRHRPASRGRVHRSSEGCDMTAACKDCRYFEPGYRRTDVGECRRKSPDLFTSLGGTRTAAWPPVHETNWCGEFASAAEAE